VPEVGTPGRTILARARSAQALAALDLRRCASGPTLLLLGGALSAWIVSGAEGVAPAPASVGLSRSAESAAGAARAAVFGFGAALALGLWGAGLLRAEGRASRAERPGLGALPIGPWNQALARWIGRCGGAAVALVLVAFAAEWAAGGGPLRTPLERFEHGPVELLAAGDGAQLPLPAWRGGALRLELATLPDTRPRTEVRLRLSRVLDRTQGTERELSLVTRADVELPVPAGEGPLALELARGAEGPAAWLLPRSLVHVSDTGPGIWASLALAAEGLGAAALCAALWPVLRRFLRPALGAAGLASVWLAAWAGAPLAQWLPAGHWPDHLLQLRRGLAPEGPTAQALGLACAAGLLALAAQVRWERRRGGRSGE
jgi:hypothetical protein